MKKILVITLLLYSTAFAQTTQAKYTDFLKYVSDGIDIEKSFKDDCEWRYALIKVNCDKNNQIINHTILNPVNNVIKKKMLFLNRYKFTKSVSIRQRPIIFCITFENHNSDCVLKNRSIAVEGAKEMYGQIAKQISNYPKSIFLNNIVVISYNYDPEP